MFRKVFLLLIILTLLSFWGCAQSDSKKILFDDICLIIDNQFYDSEFNGIDWNNIKKIYAEKISEEMPDAQFYELINEMFNKFNVSHLGIFYPNMPDNLLQLAMCDGWAGINLKVVDNKILVTRVIRDSPAEKAGIKKGTIILKINGRDLTDIKKEADKFMQPPFNKRAALAMLNIRTEYQTYGNVGEEVKLEFFRNSKFLTVDVERIERPGKTVMVQGAPPSFIEFEHKLIDEEIGYVRFNYFGQSILEKILKAIDLYKNKDGLIIDLRSNFGGMFEVRKPIADRFGKERKILWRQNGRRGVNDIYINPPGEKYNGRLVILTDVVSASSAEEFAGGLQALGLATVIGEPTQGRVLVADFTQIKPGVMMMYPVAKTTLANGKTLENHGITPDIKIYHTIESLFEGKDIQLEKAIEYLKQEFKQELR